MNGLEVEGGVPDDKSLGTGGEKFAPAAVIARYCQERTVMAITNEDRSSA